MTPVPVPDLGGAGRPAAGDPMVDGDPAPSIRAPRRATEIGVVVLTMLAVFGLWAFLPKGTSHGSATTSASGPGVYRPSTPTTTPTTVAPTRAESTEA